jgi:hypothetical protein
MGYLEIRAKPGKYGKMDSLMSIHNAISFDHGHLRLSIEYKMLRKCSKSIQKWSIPWKKLVRCLSLLRGLSVERCIASGFSCASLRLFQTPIVIIFSISMQVLPTIVDSKLTMIFASLGRDTLQQQHIWNDPKIDWHESRLDENIKRWWKH